MNSKVPIDSWKHGDGIFGVGPLAFDKVIGVGAFSSVWGAFHLQRNEYVAVKVQYHSDLDRRQTARFNRDGEAELISLWEKASDELNILETVHGCKRVAGLIEILEHETVEARLVVTDYVPYESMHWDSRAERYYIPTRNVLELEGAPRAAYRLNTIGFVALATEVLEGVKDLHERGVYHRDLKPENIRLIGRFLEDEVVKLDLEVASEEDEPEPCIAQLTHRGNVERELLWDRAKDSSELLPDIWLSKLDTPDLFVSDPEMDGTWIRLVDFNTAVKSGDGLIWDAEGTTAFTPPEAFVRPQGGSRTFSGEKRDVWSVGVLLFAGVTGSLPFWDHTPLAMQCNIITKEISFAEVDKNIPPEIAFILKCMLHKDPAKRAGVKQLLAMLDHLCKKAATPQIVEDGVVSTQTTAST